MSKNLAGPAGLTARIIGFIYLAGFALVPEAKAAGTQAYNLGMVAVAVSGLILNAAFFQTGLLPRWLVLWGLVGYAVLLVGMISELFSSGLGLFSTIPGGLWEVFTGVWLLVKGFESKE